MKNKVVDLPLTFVSKPQECSACRHVYIIAAKEIHFRYSCYFVRNMLHYTEDIYHARAHTYTHTGYEADHSPYLVPRLRMHGAIPLLTHTSSWHDA